MLIVSILHDKIQKAGYVSMNDVAFVLSVCCRKRSNSFVLIIIFRYFFFSRLGYPAVRWIGAVDHAWMLKNNNYYVMKIWIKECVSKPIKIIQQYDRQGAPPWLFSYTVYPSRYLCLSFGLLTIFTQICLPSSSVSLSCFNPAAMSYGSRVPASSWLLWWVTVHVSLPAVYCCDELRFTCKQQLTAVMSYGSQQSTAGRDTWTG